MNDNDISLSDVVVVPSAESPAGWSVTANDRLARALGEEAAAAKGPSIVDALGVEPVATSIREMLANIKRYLAQSADDPSSVEIELIDLDVPGDEDVSIVVGGEEGEAREVLDLTGASPVTRFHLADGSVVRITIKTTGDQL